MNIRTWIKYEVPHIPARCRNPRFEEREEYVDIPLREVEGSMLTLAYEDNSYQGKGKIYRYGGKLWAKAIVPRHLKEDELVRMNVKTPLDWLVYSNANCSTYFCSGAYRRASVEYVYTPKANMLKRAKADMRKRILVNGELYEQTCKPEYFILTFGCGNGDGTGLFVRYPARRDCGWRFPATKGAEAVAMARHIALYRRDFEDVKRFKADIVVY